MTNALIYQQTRDYMISLHSQNGFVPFNCDCVGMVGHYDRFWHQANGGSSNFMENVFGADLASQGYTSLRDLLTKIHSIKVREIYKRCIAQGWQDVTDFNNPQTGDMGIPLTPEVNELADESIFQKIKMRGLHVYFFNGTDWEIFDEDGVFRSYLPKGYIADELFEYVARKVGNAA